MPSWQTTVVPELLGGTTTVVFSAGGGLELLMQPASSDAATIKLEMTFTFAPWFETPMAAMMHGVRAVDKQANGALACNGASYKDKSYSS